VNEVAHMVDEMNAELIDAITSLVAISCASNAASQAVLLSHLRRVLAEYKPWRAESEQQHELFPADTRTGTQTGVVAGQMP